MNHLLGGRNLVVDTLSEVYVPLKNYSTHEFWNLAEHTLIPNSVYVIGRKQFVENLDIVKRMAESSEYCVVFDNAAEGSWTLISQLQVLKIDDLVIQNKILLISGGDLESNYPHIVYEHFLSCITDYEENLQAMKHIDSIFNKIDKPYKFLFLNGRARPHRKYLYERFKKINLLEQSLWTMLDSRPSLHRLFQLTEHDINLMATVSELKRLPPHYEFNFFKNTEVTPGPPERTFIKPQMFNNLWGEIYLEPAPYVDTYFSLVSETVFEHPCSFRTEKIAKPIAIGHPWIVAANYGFYKDIRNLGFKTFSHVIDESFDLINNHQDRMDRIIEIVDDLCKQDLGSFMLACEEVCKYNQQHLIEVVPKWRSQLPEQFFNLINKYE